jgi:hypothetical protein
VKELVLVRPETDDIETLVSQAWAQPFVDRHTPSLSHRILDLRGGDVSRVAVEGHFSDTRVVIYFGHSTASTVGEMGRDSEVYIDSSNVGLAAGCALIVFGCWSGLRLGPVAVKNGVETYVGLDDVLYADSDFAALVAPLIDTALDELVRGASVSDIHRTLREEVDRLSIAVESNEELYRSYRQRAAIYMALRLMYRALCIFT